MKILIVEDDDVKAKAVEECIASLGARSGDSYEVTRAYYLGQAVQFASSTVFDVVVLDLMLPYLSDGRAEVDAGVEIMRLIRSADALNSGTTIVGLSAFPEEIENHRAKFEAAGVLILKYDDKEEWKTSISRVFADVARKIEVRISVDYLIFVALEDERAGFNSTVLQIEKDSIVNGLNVRYTRLEVNGNVSYGAIVKLRQMGLVAATLDIALALQTFSTRIACMSGICAGFSKEAALGQLIVASPAWEYQAGKWSANAFEIAPCQIPLPAHTRVLIDQTFTSESFLNEVTEGIDRTMRRPAEWVGPKLAPAATGSAVIASSQRLKHIAKQHRKIAALDMESFGLYYAAHEAAPGLEHYFSVKCVVDLADSQKGDELHAYGSALAARASVCLLQRMLAI